MKSRKTRRLKKRLSHKKVRKTRKTLRKKRKTLRKKRKTLRKKQRGGYERGKREEEEKVCSICLGELHNGSGEYITDCNHTFHYRCIKRWGEREVVNGRNVTCPMCRAPIRTPFYPTRGTETVKYANGQAYEGGWKDGKRHGQGKFTDAYGDTYEGEWKDGKKHGQGK